jgi:hypothetical protein
MGSHGRRWFLVLVLLASWLPAARATADPPPTGDILAGRRTLLRSDDVVVVGLGLEHIVVPTAATVVVPTANSRLGQAHREEESAIPFFEAAGATPVSLADEVAPHALGRILERTRDVLVGLVPRPDGLWHLRVTDARAGESVEAVVPTDLRLAAHGQGAQAVFLGDIDGDGLAEAIVAYRGLDAGGHLRDVMRVVKVVNVADLGQGVVFGPEMALTIAQAFSTLRTGDLDGDGRAEILTFDGRTLSLLSVHPVTLEISASASVTLPGTDRLARMNVMAGRFRLNAGVDDVVVAGQREGGPVGLSLYAFAGDRDGLDLVTFQTHHFSSKSDHIVHLFMDRGPLVNFVAGQDHLVIGLQLGGQIGSVKPFVEIYGLGEDLGFAFVSNTEAASGDSGGLGCLYGMAVGNFDHRAADGQVNPALQIATLWRQSGALAVNCGLSEGPPGVRLWSVTPASGTGAGAVPNWLRVIDDVKVLGDSADPVGISLRVGDTQGRSVLLGPPEKVTIQGDIRPDIVLGMPPMHADWIDPVHRLDPAQYPGCDQSPQPCELNLTILPSRPSPNPGFNTQYSFSSTASNNYMRKSTTSWSLAVKVTLDVKGTYPIVPGVGMSGEVKQSAGYTHEGTLAHTRDQYDSDTQQLTAITGFDDYVFYTSRTQNLFYYPVIGHTACPGDRPDCAAGERRPLHVVFSAPTETTHVAGDGSLKDWYQPAHEPGNALSYPWSLAQLRLNFPGLVPLTTDQVTWPSTDTSQSTFKTSWSGKTEASNTAGSVNSETYSLSASMSGKVGLEGAAGSDITESVDLNQSTSVSTLNTSTQILDAATGIEVTKPVFPSAVADHYAYPYVGYIFGIANPHGSPHTIHLDDAQGRPVDVQSVGPLMVGFLADPVRTGNQWWPDVYSRPDVGVVHSERWQWTQTTQKATFNAAEPGVPPEEQAFYRMKGLFVSTATAPAHGLQRNYVTAGEALVLTARVHNFSLVDTDDPGLAVPAASVRVRFFAQEWPSPLPPLLPNVFEIGEAQIPSIAGFNTTRSAQGGTNWATVSVPFDTTALANTHLMFWVVVWMEDAQGNLVPEQPGHGLTATPRGATYAQVTDVPTEKYSNNVGLWGAYTPLFVAPRDSVGGPGTLTAGMVSAPRVALLDRKARVTAELRAARGPLDGVPVAFYDGDPAQGGRLFDFRHLPHVRAEEPHVVRTLFRPQACGPHTIVVVAGTAATGQVSGRTTVAVAVRPAEVVEGLMTSVRQLEVERGIALGLLRKLEVAHKAFEKAQTSQGRQQVASFEQEVAGRRGRGLSAAQADGLLGHARLLQSCPFEADVTPTVTALAGNASGVGDGTGNGRVRITGRFTLPAPMSGLDLARARVKVTSLLAESGAAGELVDRVVSGPVELVPRAGGRATSAVFEFQPASARPSMRMDVRRRSDATAEFNLVMDRAVLSRDPLGCSTGPSSATSLTMRFAIDDGQRPPVEVEAVRPWTCAGRAPTPGSELSLR